MVFRGGVRNNPRVLKEARTLADAGYRVLVVAMKIPGEQSSVERIDRTIVLRTATGFVQRAKRWLRSDGAARPAADASSDPSAAARLLSPAQVVKMLTSRTLLALKMAALIHHVRPDVVHAHDFSALPAAGLAARLAKTPLIYDAHEVNVDREGYYRQLRWLISAIERLLIRRCDRVITTTAIRARHFRRWYRLCQMPTVLQNRPPAYRADASCDFRALHGVPADGLVCIYQGGLQEGRGLRNLIRAVSSVEGVHCVLLGTGHQAEALQHLARELHVADRVHFHGKVELHAVPGLTASADVGIQVIRNTCFNHWSTDSNKLFEYAMAGLPVIASNFPEIRRVVNEFQIGLLVDPESVPDISCALERYRNDPEIRCRFRGNALASARELSWESQAPTLLSLYADLLPSR